MTWRDYQAKVVREMRRGNVLPNLDAVVLIALKSFPQGCKREELCSQVSALSDVYLDEVIDNINHCLNKLKKQGKAINPVRGYWKAV